MTKAAELAKMGEVLTNSQIGGRRNIIINGAMQVAQRGTSFSSITSSTYTLDRFAVRNATAVSQSTDVPSGEGFESSLFYDSDGTRSSSNIRQPMEDVTRLLNDTAVTLSFWLKSSAATTISVDLCDANATNVDVTTSWAKYTVTFPATSNLNSGDTYEAGAGWVDFNLGSDYPDVYLTGVQLEVGEQATPFEHRSFGEELDLCQRYYYKQADGSENASQSVGVAFMESSSVVVCCIDLPTTMRATPSNVSSSVTDGFQFYRNGAADNFTDTYIANAHPNIFTFFNHTQVSGTAGQAGSIKLNSSATSYIAVDAEL